jgi:formylglycine-generating enzyme required for sulfatase activity
VVCVLTKLNLQFQLKGPGCSLAALVLAVSGAVFAAEPPAGQLFTNTLGMEFVRIEPGTFSMGSENGHFDERPVHDVAISRAFYISKYEVTNALYDQFDAAHASLDHRGFSRGGNEAVIFVSFDDANGFCAWLGGLEGLPYRLPTEAEWEYACRAGTTTAYHTGETLPSQYEKNPGEKWEPQPTDLTVGQSPANAWGLFDMHGNVEEWVYDWYGPYDGVSQADPVGRIGGDFRVTRGGSHSTTAYYLRSANRMGTLPGDKHWMIGFRVVLGEMPATEPLPQPPPQPYQLGVSQEVPPDVNVGPDPGVPYFAGPVPFVDVPPGSDGPLFDDHNHQPAICACPNGDLLAIWYSTMRESGRELAVAASRMPRASGAWQAASLFWDGPDRNDHGSALWNDGGGKIYHFNGLAEAATWGSLALVMRTSADNGASWSPARLVNPRHGRHHQVIAGPFRTLEGHIILACDADPASSGGSVIHLSTDEGLSWMDPAFAAPQPDFTAGGTGDWIAGIHAGVAQLADGRLLAFGRGNDIDGKMPLSVSDDLGENWTYWPSGFPPISGGQRLILLRLSEGPLLLVSFTGAGSSGGDGLVINDARGERQRVYGMFAALSHDDGRTWPVKKLVSPGGELQAYDGGGNTGWFVADDTHAEPKGYLAATQSPDGVIHVISSAQHYRFNLAWLNAGFRVVEDFEQYAGDADLAGYWQDWHQNNTNAINSLETAGHESAQSLRCTFDNDSPPFYSASDLVFDPPRDFTAGGKSALSLWFRGAGGSAGRFYVRITGGASADVDHPDPGELADGLWHNWPVDLALFAASGVNLSQVERLSVGLSDGGFGAVLVDDVELHPQVCLYDYADGADFNGDCVIDGRDLEVVAADWLKAGYDVPADQPDPNCLLLWYKLDETSGWDVSDSSGRNRHGTVVKSIGLPSWDPGGGRNGGCLAFNDDTAIAVPDDTLSGIGDEITICVWLNGGDSFGRENTVFETGDGVTFLRADVPNPGGIVFFRAGAADETVFWSGLQEDDWRGYWNHWAFVKDAGSAFMRIYHNGGLVAEASGTAGSLAPAAGATFDIGATIAHKNDYKGKMDDFRVYGCALSESEVAGAADTGAVLHVPVNSPADIYADDKIDLKDYSVLAGKWLETGLWPAGP